MWRGGEINTESSTKMRVGGGFALPRPDCLLALPSWVPFSFKLALDRPAGCGIRKLGGHKACPRHS